MFIDSHAHIDGEEFDADREVVIARAGAAGVSAILNVGTGNPHDGVLERAVTLAEQHENIYAAVGTHPHDARFYDDAAEERIRELARSSPKVVAWGEIGLDFHYDHSPRSSQLAAFEKQLAAARDSRLPVIIHTRDAEEQTITLLKSVWEDSGLAAVFHCFTGSSGLAEKAIELGCLISFSGIVTFKKAGDLREIAKMVPSERLLIETDCPFLAPIPFRGKRNEPAYVVEVARLLAEVRGVTLEELAGVTTQNFYRSFQISPPASA